MERILLTGFMGAGKSTLGPKVARRLGFQFVDTDRLIEKSLGYSIVKLFSEEGEAVFREYEERVTRGLLSRSQVVVATGGGLPVHADSFPLLREASLTVFLHPPLEWMWRRASGDGRPLAEEREQFEELFRERLPVYREADLELDPSEVGVVRAVDIILNVFYEERFRTDR